MTRSFDPSFMSRRTFLHTASAAAAGAMLFSSTACASAQMPLAGRIKKAIVYNMFQSDAPVVEKFRALKEAGFQGVEAQTKAPEDPAEMVAAARETGVEIHSLMHGSVDNIPSAVDRAKALGVNVILIVAGRVNEQKSYQDNYTETQAVIREALPYAAANEVTLLVENVWNNFLLSPLEMARYIDEFESPWIQSYFDVGNVVRFAWPEHWIPVLGSRIKRVHVKEYSRDKQMNEGLWKGFDVEMGEGSIDWELVRKELLAIDYTGWVTAEVGGGDIERMKEISRQMDSILALC
ncbi:MAG TPA: sugar phosphate isomerase/epimerase family protein [Candidatus Hydrogenedentes bacterium]|jgi:hexulose-6-phosphate isomerase|nr:MAG: L-ribulose-5-phosphate 3-epimerase UlaE [Candidatus Hydrogenedentes bacterium ADurb.Bin170]HPX86062.1 sugar phosphate isomerase/epimerase family protein [Candidatus Hydrogenedentota bacterium]HQB04022.1 sugar phosphate isomerase/epimerase family protein [Candidatus Hydrogenedentota bacterium]